MRWHVTPTANPLTAMSDYSIYLTEEEADWVEKHKEETGAKSRSKVIRNAIEHYREAVEEENPAPSQ